MSGRRERISRVYRILEEEKLDALVFFLSENIYYLSGFRGEGVLIIGTERNYLVTDGRYISQAEAEALGFEIRQSRKWIPGVAGVLKERSFRRVGFEAEGMSYSGFLRWKNLSEEIELVPVEEKVSGLRAIKEPEEVEKIRKAAMISEKAFQEVKSGIRSGMSEREIAINYEYRVKQLGSEALPFEPIVAFGTRSAWPHARSSGKLLDAKEWIIFDFGAKVEGYAADLTRTFCPGKEIEERKNQGQTRFEFIYQLVREAQMKAMAVVRPGVLAAEVDRAARSLISQAGYGDFFLHSTGHGVGLSVHEAPTISEESRQVLEAGMIFTLEPGVYIAGEGGVRIEDLVLVTEKGAEILSGGEA